MNELLPDAEELFDYIFINHLVFDDRGTISGVTATPYDFEGKAVALQQIAQEHGLDLSQVAFIGEGFNDGPVAAVGMKAAANIEIPEDDLTSILPHVM